MVQHNFHIFKIQYTQERQEIKNKRKMDTQQYDKQMGEKDDLQ